MSFALSALFPCSAAISVALLPHRALVAQDKQPPARPESHPLRAHDPSTILRHKGVYWTFVTGRGVPSLRSNDLVHWQEGPTVFRQPPRWIQEVVPTQKGYFWAPDVIEIDGRFLLYYSVSAFGKQTSAIALATSATLGPGDPEYGWTDEGIVVQTDESSDHNAIDPCVVRGEKGTLWMAYGSYWSGIKLIELNPKSGKRIAPDSPVHALAHKQEIEAAAIYRHEDHYYLFVNWGHCCRGVRSTYNIRIGRSAKITGPYLDKEGVDLLEGGGSRLLETEGRFIGPGHAGILKEGERYWLSFHFYDREDDGRPKLAIRPLEWTGDGWPVVRGPPKTPSPEE